jgi:hypothetical protein
MANLINGRNPFVLDTAGATVSLTTEVRIKGIKVVPSSTTWSVILKNSASEVIYADNQNRGDSSNSIFPITTVGLVLDTCTNATVYIYF